MLTAFALEQRARLVTVRAKAAAARANGVAASGRPSDLFEGFGSFVLAHARDLRQTERPGLRAEEEVLRHNDANRFG